MIHCEPSIRWDVLQAPAIAKPGSRYEGHLPGSGVQRHSADNAYALYGIVMLCRESADGKHHLWQAMIGQKVVASHPKHNAARFMALALCTGA